MARWKREGRVRRSVLNAMGATVTKREASLESKYPCRDCERVITGKEVQEGVQVYYADRHRDPLLTTYRCSECFDDRLQSFHH